MKLPIISELGHMKADVVSRYLGGARLPWSDGYSKYRSKFIADAFANAELMARLRDDQSLPTHYGVRMDERVVECPWVVAKLRPGQGRILDAGSVMNRPVFLELPQIRERDLIIYSLDMNWIHLNPKVSYLFGDFRDALLNDEIVETVICVSTLEHVGMWNYPIAPFDEWIKAPQPVKDPLAYRGVLSEFRRMLKSGGQLLLTVPFGRRMDLDWLQQFDAAGIDEIIRSFGGQCRTEAYYRYTTDGWRRATRDECADNEHVDVIRAWAHGRQPDFGPDVAASARSIACLELERT